jgi:MFS family permease
LRAYRDILGRPGVGLLLAAATIARLSPAIGNLAILLYTADQTGSFAAAGAAVGAFALGISVGAPLTARICDRRGLGMLVPFATAHAVAMVAIWLLAGSGAAIPVIVVSALAAGCFYPPTGASLRARWQLLVDGRLLPSAYALDSVATSVSFLAGPLITAALVATAGAGVALPAAGAAALLASTVFVARAPALAPERSSHTRWLGPLAAAGMRTMVVWVFAAGFAMGSLEVAVAGFATEGHGEALAAVLLSLWSVSSAAASFGYGVRAPAWPLRRQIHATAFALPLATLLVAAAGSPVVMAALLVISAIPYAPMVIVSNQLVGEVAPRGTATEAYTWVVTATVAGTAAGGPVAGALVEDSTWQAAIAVGVAVGLAGAALLLLRRRTL